MEQFTSSSELVAIVGSLTPFLTAFAGAVIGAGAALFGIWTQDRFQRRREATEYIRSIRLKPIDDLSQAIAGGEQILAQFDLIRGNFRAVERLTRDGITPSEMELNIPMTMIKEFNVAVRRAGISLDAMDAPEDVKTTLVKLPFVIHQFSVLNTEALRTQSFQAAVEQMNEPAQEVGNLLIDLKRHNLQLQENLAGKAD